MGSAKTRPNFISTRPPTSSIPIIRASSRLGDFDGDGRTDVFVATGTAWFFLRGGVEPWEFLHASNKRTSQLAFADIDNDGVTDVLYRDGAGNIGSLRSGIVALVPLTTSPVPLSEMRFEQTSTATTARHVLHETGQWHVWYGSTRGTDDDADVIDRDVRAALREVRRRAGNRLAAVKRDGWAYSSASTGVWTRLNAQLKSSFANAVAADFDGDGKTDIAFDEGNQNWSYSPGGALPLRSLRDGSSGDAYPPLKRLVIGHFDGKTGCGGRRCFYRRPADVAA